MAKNDAPQTEEPRSTGLGTFAGVFTPSILTILGLILFLRLGYVVGDAGLGRALVIILMANAISLLTTFSLAAIATNIKVKGGGDYYLISRTLGVEFGGAIGIVLFLAQSISIGFYTIGFGEAGAALLGLGPLWAQGLAALALAGLFVLAWLGADWATRFQFIIMAILFAGIASFFYGGWENWDTDLLRSAWSPSGELPFWALFALFFPAVTGFTQGVSMSGDLKDPGRSLPLGTFLAVALSLVVYLAVAVFFAGSVPGAELVSDYGAMRRDSAVPWLIDTGVFAATLSSGLASFLGAPRILQSLARDRTFPFLTFFAQGAGPTDNPRRGVLLSMGIALVCIALGNLNLIAPVVTMFFLVSYGLLNYATFYEARSKSPSFRPRFRWFDARLSLAGGLGCLIAMIAIQPTAGAVSIALLMAIQQYLKSSSRVERWSDSSRSSLYQQVRRDLHAMKVELEHPRDWRPAILAFSQNPERRERLMRFASWIEGGSGFTTAVQLVVGEGPKVRMLARQAESELRKDLAQRGLDSFALVVVAPDPHVGFTSLLQAHGLGPIRANTVLLNWFDQERAALDASGLRVYGRQLRNAVRYGCNVVILGATNEQVADLLARPARERCIDVWWRDDATSRLALLLAHLMRRSEEWEGAKVRALSTPGEGQTVQEREEQLQKVLEDARISATPIVLPEADVDGLVAESSESSVVFLGFRVAGDEPMGPHGEALGSLVARLPMVALVLAAQDISLDSDPDEGLHGQIAAALDGADEAEKRAAQAEGDAQAAAAELEGARGELAGVAEGEPRGELEAKVAEAEEAATQAARRAAKARAKAGDQRKVAEELVARARSHLADDVAAPSDPAPPASTGTAEPG